MRTNFEIPGGPYTQIKLQQHGRDSFRVVYGQQVDDRLTYAQAAAKLGEAIMHKAACDGLLDNRERGEA